MTLTKQQLDDIEKQALKEICDERFAEAVKKKKEQILNKKSFWDIVFPYKILIIKKEKK